MVYLSGKLSSTLEQYKFMSKSMQDIKKHQHEKAVLWNHGPETQFRLQRTLKPSSIFKSNMLNYSDCEVAYIS